MKRIILSIFILTFAFILVSCSKSYVVSFDTQGGNKIESIEVKQNEKVDCPNNPIKEGYNFIEWQLNGVKYNFDSKITEDITLVAKWEKQIETYTISYDAQGATLPSDAVTSFEENQEVTLPELTKEGYNFLGWYEGEQKVEEIENKNYSLVAKFEAIKYTISYTNDGSQVTNPVEYTIESETIVLTNPEKAGYNFLGWYEGEQKIEQIEKGSTKNYSLVAKWETVKYTISYDLDGGNAVSNPVEYTIESETITLINPEKEGYNFLGWYEGEQKIEQIEKGSTKNYSLVAKWEVQKFLLTLMDGETELSSEEIAYGSDLSVFVPSKEDYKFLGWLDENDELITFNTMPAKELILKASWELSYTVYTIEYDLDGGFWPRDVLYETRDEMVADFLLDFNTFNGSSVTASNFFSASYNCQPVENFFGSTTYKAKWSWFKQYIYDTCTKGGYANISFLTNESDQWHNAYFRSNIEGFLKAGHQTTWPASYDFSNDADANGYYEYIAGEELEYPTSYTYVSETIVLPKPKKDSFVFVGWFDEDNNEVTQIEKNSRGNITLTARWTVIEYTISYNLNGGDSTGLITGYDSNLSSTLHLVNPTKAGYAFIGFYETSDFSGKKVRTIEVGSQKDYTLYAKWAEEKLGGHKTISFYGDSISTFENYVPSDALIYYPLYSSTVKQVELTWWHKVMEQTGTTFHTNTSYSGSTVRGTSTSCGENDTRINKVASNGVAPDILIIYLGINDCASGYSATDFETSYNNMLTKMKEKYSETDIFICTLPYETWTDGSNPDGKNYPGLRESYNEIIKEMAEIHNVGLIDIEPCITKATESLTSKTYLGDNIHPNAAGMQVIADKVSETLEEFYK